MFNKKERKSSISIKSPNNTADDILRSINSEKSEIGKLFFFIFSGNVGKRISFDQIKSNNQSSLDSLRYTAVKGTSVEM